MRSKSETGRLAGLIAAGTGGAAGVASSVVGVSPSHVAIVAGSTAAVALASSVPWSRPRDGRAGGDIVEADVLRALVRAYQPLAREFTNEISTRLGILKAGRDVRAAVAVTLPSGDAAGVAQAMEAFVFAWRMGAAIADVEEAFLPTSGRVSPGE